MTTRLTPTERLLLALLQLHPGSTADALFEASRSQTSKHFRAALRTLVMAGKVTALEGDVATLYTQPTEPRK